MDVSFDTKLQAVMDYYQGSTTWDKIMVGGYTKEQINAMYNSLPAQSFSFDVSVDGTVLGRDYTNPFELPVTPGTDFDSNIAGGSYGAGNNFYGNIPANLEVDNQGNIIRQTSGATNGLGQTVSAIADKVSLAVTGVNIGAKLGLKFDELLYESDPEFWNNNLPGLNPETWNSLVGYSDVGDFFLRTIFGITDSGMSGYINEETLAYYYQMMRDAGFWSEGSINYTPPDGYSTGYTLPLKVVTGDISLFTNSGNYDFKVELGNAEYIVLASKDDQLSIDAVGRAPFTSYYDYISKSSGQVASRQEKASVTIVTGINHTTVYRSHITTRTISGLTNYSDLISLVNPTTAFSDVQLVTIIYDGTKHESSARPDGVTTLPNSTQYPSTNITGTTPQEVLDELKNEYPDLFQNPIHQTVLQPDGTLKDYTYVPIPWVTEDLTQEQATTGEDKTQTDYELDPQTGDKTLEQTEPDEPTNPPETGDGSGPVPILPVGNASSLWAIYNPTQGELNSFGAWLWSSNFVEQLKKLFNDPMQAIIGVHKVFATPSTSGSATIKCGYLDSGVSAAVVSNQYTSVNCGSASLREYFGNVLDYDPFTKVSLFLPFIGIVPLNTADVMRSTVSVKYSVDVITGACLAEVTISRDGGGGILYTYGGSAIVTYPISSGSYAGVIQGAISAIVGIGAAIATKGASWAASASAIAGGISQAETRVQHSGQLSGCSGAMGGKKPYLIISRPQTRIPDRISEFKGTPSNTIRKISDYSGFIKVKEVHFTSQATYDNEAQEIEALLKTGVII